MISRRLIPVAVAVVLVSVSQSATAGPHDHHGSNECRPTAEQRQEAADFARRTKAAAERYENQGNAVDDNYRPWVDAWKPVYHFVNYSHYYDWKILDPKRPEAYVYAHTFTGEKLIGVMYSMEDPGRKPPPMGGCITRWHTHPQCKSPIGYSHIWEEDWGDCPPGWEEDPEGSEQMLHVWTVPMKDGPYSYHPDPKWDCWPNPVC